jgi:Acetyltransferase (GNAT) domain
MSTTDDAISIRHPTEGDWQAIYENQARTFGDPVGRRDVGAWTRRVELEGHLVAEDVSDPKQPFLVGTSIIYRARLTVPGGAGVQAAWLTMIAVASTPTRAREFGGSSAPRVWESSSTGAIRSSAASQRRPRCTTVSARASQVTAVLSPSTAVSRSCEPSRARFGHARLMPLRRNAIYQESTRGGAPKPMGR